MQKKKNTFANQAFQIKLVLTSTELRKIEVTYGNV